IGTEDLDETSQILERLRKVDWKDRPDAAALEHAANGHLGRASLNRALDALHSGRPVLARAALRRAFVHSPAVLGAIIRDPRLCVQMAALAAAPGLAARVFGKRMESTGDRVVRRQ